MPDLELSRLQDAAAPVAASFYDARSYVMSESVLHKLVQIVAAARREVELRMAQHDLTDAQWKPLWLVQQGCAGTAIELAREMGIDAGATTRALDRLAAKGLLERVRSTTDRRVVHIVLTAAGADVATRIPEVLAGINNEFLRGFTRQEWLQLHDFAHRLLLNCQQMPQAEALAKGSGGTDR